MDRENRTNTMEVAYLPTERPRGHGGKPWRELRLRYAPCLDRARV
jgi:hypothetical protein